MLLSALLQRFVGTGRLTVVDPSGRSHAYGPGAGPCATVRIRRAETLRRLLGDPELALGEAYMEGDLVLEQGSLHDFLEICTSAGPRAAPCVPARAASRLVPALARWRKANTRARARANVAHHYDLSRRLYELFLDADLQYSCAYFPRGDETLEEAQAAKKRHIAAKLLLEPGLSVLDVGSGWGGLALELARSAGVEVTGVTLSQEQLAVARERAQASGLADRARFELRDYRDQPGTFDRLVSVGMFEHVGPAHYDEFFRVWARLLKPDGVGLLHTIGRMAPPPSGPNPWIDKYIFPGGCCPSLSEVVAAAERSGLWITDIEILRLHYADTLRCWFDRFQRYREEVRALHDERFCRMWEFYLVASEMGFRNGSLAVFQVQLAHRRDAAPLTRDYMFEEERRLARGSPVVGFPGRRARARS